MQLAEHTVASACSTNQIKAMACSSKGPFFTTRRRILTAVLILALLAGVPVAIHRYVTTGDLYLFSERFFEDMLARFSGPGRLRFIFQPLVAILLGARDGIKDFRTGLPPFLWSLTFHSIHRTKLIYEAIASVYDLIAVAIILDMIFQFLIFHRIHPGAALLLGPVLISLPYAVSRALSNRVGRGSAHRHLVARHQ